MNNYYENKLNELLKLRYEENEAINDICNIYLDDKPKKIAKDDRTNQFWFFIENTELIELLDNELLILCIVKVIKEKYIFSDDFITKIFNKEKEIFIRSIKCSKVFLDSDNTNFKNIQKYYLAKSIKIDFFKACAILLNKYTSLLGNKNQQFERLKSFAYLDLLCTISLYMMKHTLENNEQLHYELNGNILTKILHDRLKVKDKKKGEYDYNKSAERILKQIQPRETYDELNRLESIMSSYEKLYLFEENILSTFCFDENFTYIVKDNILELNVIDTLEYKKWFIGNKKLDIIFEYYFAYGIHELKELLENNIFGNIENNDINKFVFAQTNGIKILLEEIYGINDKLNVSESVTLPLFESVHSLNNLAGFYKKYFLVEYINLSEKYQWNEAYHKFFLSGMKKFKQRFPIIIQEQYTFSNNMRNEDPSFTELDRKNIETFFTFDLKKINENKEEKIPNIFEKPLFKLDNIVFIMPFVLGLQNLFTSIINNLLNVHFKRIKSRKEEVHQSESNLSKLFKELNFQVQANYLLPLSIKYEIGDIDLICKKDDYLFVLELKSTYIRTSLENIWQYKSNALRKASNQLSKRKRLINQLIKDNNQEFKELFGVPKKVIYLIIDTSFEFDHEMFDENLKISMFELINLLNANNDELYPSGFSTEKFVENIYNELYWEKFINKNIQIDENEINYRIYI